MVHVTWDKNECTQAKVSDKVIFQSIHASELQIYKIIDFHSEGFTTNL